MALLLDYSTGPLAGESIKAAGYAGAIRYIDSPARLSTKHTNPAEYHDHTAAGLIDYLVFERTVDDMLGGFNAGQDNAASAAQGADYIGYPDDLPIFMTADRHATAAENAAHWPVWQQYLDGAASVLGKDRLGAYGFAEALDFAAGHATWFWQCGSRTVLRGFTHLYQRNTGTVQVAGIDCDVNDILKELTVPLSDDEITRIATRVWHWQLPNPVISTPASPVPELLQTTLQYAEQRIVARLAAGVAASQQAVLAAIQGQKTLSAGDVHQVMAAAMAQVPDPATHGGEA